MELTVQRTYKVILPDEKDYELKLNDEEFPFAELVDACTREADVGNLSGTMLYVIYKDGERPEDDVKSWIHKKDRYAEFVLRSCEYSCQEVQIKIDDTRGA